MCCRQAAAPYNSGIALCAPSFAISKPHRLQNALSGRFFHLQLRDRTVPPRDLWEGAGEDSLEGRYFQILQQAAQNATGPEAEALCLAARISRRILEGQEVTLP